MVLVLFARRSLALRGYKRQGTTVACFERKVCDARRFPSFDINIKNGHTGGYKTDVKERKKNKGKASAKEQGERGILKRCKAGEEKI